MQDEDTDAVNRLGTLMVLRLLVSYALIVGVFLVVVWLMAC